MLVAVAVGVVLGGCSAGDDGGGAGGSTTETTSATTTSTTTPNRVPAPVVTEASGGHGQPSGGLDHDATAFGYDVREYLFEGTAHTFPPFDEPDAPYRSRMIVYTPSDPDEFNGVTVVEWAHVSDFGQFELAVELNAQAPMLEEQGYAFVLVSAEEGGICDETDAGCTGASLKGADPERYGTLEHPGDPYSFDIFNQALQAVRYPTDLAPLGDLDAGIVVVEGFQPSIDKWFPTGDPSPDDSESPFGVYGPLNAYLANGADEEAQLADAFLVDAAAPKVEPDYRVPVLHNLDESAIRREPTADSPNHVTWEVVGSPHADRWSGTTIRIPSSAAPDPWPSRAEEEARRDQFDEYGQAPFEGGDVCAPGPRTGSVFPRRYTVNAALAALGRWVETGEPAPEAPRIERVGPVPTDASKKLARGADGMALGGLRLPIVEVPVATYNGETCIQAGTTVAFGADELAGRYPTHAAYVDQLLAAVDEAVDAGFLVCQDAETIMRKASESDIGGTDPASAAPSCAE